MMNYEAGSGLGQTSSRSLFVESGRDFGYEDNLVQLKKMT